jgi:hypothetical protein
MNANARHRAFGAPPALPVPAPLSLLAARVGPTDQGATGPADPSLPQQRQICFPATVPSGARTVSREDIVIWTDAPLDGPALLSHLRQVNAYLESILPPPQVPASKRAGGTASTRPVALAVYRTPEDYQALWRRVEKYYGGSLPPVTTEGFSCRVFCATSYESAEAFARRRSLLCHEFAHVWLYQNRSLRNDGNWLTEGLGTAVQLKFFPASGDRKDFAAWLESGRMLPLKRMLDLERIAPKDYWQAGTLVELLIARYRDRLPAVVSAFNEGASPQRIVTDVLQTDMGALQRQWAEHVADRGK